MKEMDFWQIYDYRAVFIFWIIAIEIDEKFVFLSLHFAAERLGFPWFSALENCLLPFSNNSPHTHSDWFLAALSRRLSSGGRRPGRKDVLAFLSVIFSDYFSFRSGFSSFFAHLSETLEGSIRSWRKLSRVRCGCFLWFLHWMGSKQPLRLFFLFWVNSFSNFLY